MTLCAIESLLREQQTTIMRERRAVDRQPFVRPVQIIPIRPGANLTGFTRDVSRHGVSVIVSEPINPGTIATLKIHSLFGTPINLRAEVRWCDPFGEGWYSSGWYFLDVP
jgi:hypothetical protein